MTLPELYPMSSAIYDQNEDIGARAMGEALVSRSSSCVYSRRLVRRTEVVDSTYFFPSRLPS